MDIHLSIAFVVVLLIIIFLQGNSTTITDIRENIGLLFSKDTEPGALEILFIFYMVLVPILFNTLVICSLGKYTLESRRSMTRCYTYSTVLVVLALLLSYLECSIYANVADGSLLFFNSVESGSLLLTNLKFTGMLFKSEIDEVKRINKVKKLGMCLILPNVRVFTLILGYFLLFTFIITYLWYKVWLLDVGLVKVLLVSTIFSSNSSLLANHLYNIKTRL